MEWNQSQEQLLRQGLAELPDHLKVGINPPNVAAGRDWNALTAWWRESLPFLSECLKAYAQILLQWHEAFHLLGEQNERDFVPLHLLDSVSGAILLLAQGRLREQQGCSAHMQIIDVGSGLGLPGIPLALCLKLYCQMQPNESVLQVYLIEPGVRRANILRSMLIELGLRDVVTVCEHPVEQWSKLQGSADQDMLQWAQKIPAGLLQRIVTCRAFRPLDRKSWKQLRQVFVKLQLQPGESAVVPWLRSALLYKGSWQLAEEELAALHLRTSCHSLFELPQCKHQRSLLLINV